MSNPHGSCESCVWHTCDGSIDVDGDNTYVWRCWRISGVPETRLVTGRPIPPPACESHLEAK